MTIFLNVLLKYVVPFLLGMSMASAIVYGDLASVTALLGAGAVYFFSAAMRPSRKSRGESTIKQPDFTLRLRNHGKPAS